MYRLRRVSLFLLPIAFAALVAGCGPDEKASAAGNSGAPSASPSASVSPSPTSNGVDALSASKILAKARKASSAAKSVHIQGKMTEESKTFEIDVRVGGERGAAGHIIMNGQRVDMIRIEDSVYMKGDDAFWRSGGGDSAVVLLSGKYVKIGLNDKDFADLTLFTFPSAIFSDLVKPKGVVTKGRGARVNGVPAVTLVDGTGGKLYVATEGKPYILRVASDKEAGSLDFLDYDKTVSVHAPPADRVVDLDELQGR